MEYEITGGAFPMVICRLKEGESMQDEAGAMTYMTTSIKMETNTGRGLLKGLGRALSGDTFFLNFFTAERDDEEVAFASCYLGRILPIRLESGRSIIGQKKAFLTAERGVTLKCTLEKNLVWDSLVERVSFFRNSQETECSFWK